MKILFICEVALQWCLWPEKLTEIFVPHEEVMRIHKASLPLYRCFFTLEHQVSKPCFSNQ